MQKSEKSNQIVNCESMLSHGSLEDVQDSHAVKFMHFPKLCILSIRFKFENGNI